MTQRLVTKVRGPCIAQTEASASAEASVAIEFMGPLTKAEASVCTEAFVSTEPLFWSQTFGGSAGAGWGMNLRKTQFKEGEGRVKGRTTTRIYWE